LLDKRVGSTQERRKPVREQLQFEFAKFSQDGTDPLMHLGLSAWLGYVRAKRKIWAINHTADQRREARDANRTAFNPASRKVPRGERNRYRLVVHGHKYAGLQSVP